jgi:type VI secretion system protein ImpI
VALGLRLRVTDTRNNAMVERTFDRFPVRIGRNPLNDFQLDSGFVSQFHAVLELHGNALMLRDLGSKNGTLLRHSGKVPPHQLVDLGPSNYEFAISSLLFQAFPMDVLGETQATRRRAGSNLLLGPEDPETQYLKAVGRPPAANVTQGTARLKAQYDAWRSSWTQYYQALCAEAQALDLPSRAALLDMVAASQPAASQEPDFQRLASVVNPNAPASANRAGAGTRDEMMALQAVKELAAVYVAGGRPMEGASDVVKFLGKVQDVLDTFFKSFIPLRDGYKQFETKMEIKRKGLGGDPRLGARVAVETAKDPKELASRLLDWNDPSEDGPRTIESTFADLMIHQVAMLDGVMRGVKSLLKELSPSAIEQLLERKKSGGFSFGPFRYETLWNLYKERHSDLADEEKEAFGLIFGPQFVQAYTQFSGEAVGGNVPTGSMATHTGPMPTYKSSAGMPAVNPNQPPPAHGGPNPPAPVGSPSQFPPPWRPPERR